MSISVSPTQYVCIQHVCAFLANKHVWCTREIQCTGKILLSCSMKTRSITLCSCSRATEMLYIDKYGSTLIQMASITSYLLKLMHIGHMPHRALVFTRFATGVWQLLLEVFIWCSSMTRREVAGHTHNRIILFLKEAHSQWKFEWPPEVRNIAAQHWEHQDTHNDISAIPPHNDTTHYLVSNTTPSQSSTHYIQTEWQSTVSQLQRDQASLSFGSFHASDWSFHIHLLNWVYGVASLQTWKVRKRAWGRG